MSNIAQEGSTEVKRLGDIARSLIKGVSGEAKIIVSQVEELPLTWEQKRVKQVNTQRSLHKSAIREAQFNLFWNFDKTR